MSADASHWEPRSGKNGKRKGEPSLDGSSRPEVAESGVTNRGLPDMFPTTGVTVRPTGETVPKGVTTNPAAAGTAYVAEGDNPSVEACWIYGMVTS